MTKPRRRRMGFLTTATKAGSSRYLFLFLLLLVLSLLVSTTIIKKIASVVVVFAETVAATEEEASASVGVNDSNGSSNYMQESDDGEDVKGVEEEDDEENASAEEECVMDTPDNAPDDDDARDTSAIHFTTDDKDETSTFITVHREMIDGIDVLYAVPTTTNTAGRTPKGIFYVAHGCGHSNTDWFQKIPKLCEDCIGLPEEIAIVEIVVRQFQFMVVVVSSYDRDDRSLKCYRSKYDNKRAGIVLQELSSRYKSIDHGHEQLPIYVYGISMGGTFVSKVGVYLRNHYNLKLSGFISQVERYPMVSPDKETPCQVYITMTKDINSVEYAKNVIASIEYTNRINNNSNNNDDVMIHAKHIQVEPIPITETYFMERISSQIKSIEQSRKLHDALYENGYLDPKTLLLEEDPRYSNWRDVIQPVIVDDMKDYHDTLVAKSSPLSAVLNVAHGDHDTTRDGIQDAVEYCLSINTKSSNKQ